MSLLVLRNNKYFVPSGTDVIDFGMNTILVQPYHRNFEDIFLSSKIIKEIRRLERNNRCICEDNPISPLGKVAVDKTVLKML